MKTHLSEKPYSCDQYTKSFSQDDKSRMHLRRNTLNVKRFSLFKWGEMRINTRERPYFYMKCQKSF